MKRGRWLVSGLGLGALAFFAAPREASASGYLSARFGSDHGTPALGNAYAVYFNPAAIAHTKGTSLTLDATLAIRSATYERSADAMSPSREAEKNDNEYIAASTGKAKLLNVLGFPFLGATSDLGGAIPLSVGFASYVPFGGMSDWKRGGAVIENNPQVADGVQRWHSISGLLLSWYNTLAVAYAFKGTGLSLGANVSVIYHTLKTIRARNSDGSDDVRGTNGGLVEGRSLVIADGVQVGVGFGAHYETKRLRIGASYTSQPGFGQMRLSGTLQQQFGADRAEAKAVPIDFLQTYPDVVRLGGSYRLNQQWEAKVDLEYVRWSVLERQCVVERGAACNVLPSGAADVPAGISSPIILNVPRKWKDSLGFRVGPSFYLGEDTEFFGSAGLSTPAAPKETIDAATVDSLRLNLALGARHEFNKHIAVAGSANLVHLFPVSTNGASIHDTMLSPSKSPSADGRYTSDIFFFNANCTYTF